MNVRKGMKKESTGLNRPDPKSDKLKDMEDVLKNPLEDLKPSLAAGSAPTSNNVPNEKAIEVMVALIRANRLREEQHEADRKRGRPVEA